MASWPLRCGALTETQCWIFVYERQQESPPHKHQSEQQEQEQKEQGRDSKGNDILNQLHAETWNWNSIEMEQNWLKL